MVIFYGVSNCSIFIVYNLQEKVKWRTSCRQPWCRRLLPIRKDNLSNKSKCISMTVMFCELCERRQIIEIANDTKSYLINFPYFFFQSIETQKWTIGK